MSYRMLPLDMLVINDVNDRHGEVEGEPEAMSALFALRELHMRNLTVDLVSSGEVYDPPLVYPAGDTYVVADGNRRVTCMKLLRRPELAPTQALRQFYAEQRLAWNGWFPDLINCRIEVDRDRIDDILLHRHTRIHNGVGLAAWDEGMRKNHAQRSGRAGPVNVAFEVEKRLAASGLLPERKIPQSRLNRLLSTEPLRNRVGFSIKRGRFAYLRKEEVVNRALQRIANDLITATVPFVQLTRNTGKTAYLDALDAEGMLPTRADRIEPKPIAAPQEAPPIIMASEDAGRLALIPDAAVDIDWSGPLQRHGTIWKALQHKLKLNEHPNAILALLRVLLELSVDYYLGRAGLEEASRGDRLGRKIVLAAEHLHGTGKISSAYRAVFEKTQNIDKVISMEALRRYIRSQQKAPSPAHLASLWDSLSDFVVLCLKA